MFEKTVLNAARFNRVFKLSTKAFRFLTVKNVTFAWNTNNAGRGLGVYVPQSFAAKMYESNESNVRAFALGSNLVVFWETDACSPFSLAHVNFKGQPVPSNYCEMCHSTHAKSSAMKGVTSVNA